MQVCHHRSPLQDGHHLVRLQTGGDQTSQDADIRQAHLIAADPSLATIMKVARVLGLPLQFEAIA